MSNRKNTAEKLPEQGPARIKFTADIALAENKGEAWRKWNVTISLPLFMGEPNPDPEKDIGKRIAYCRAQMDNLSVKALARYTKRFDREGVSAMAITRYEGGAVPLRPPRQHRNPDEMRFCGAGSVLRSKKKRPASLQAL
jgi:hypothetical protein